MHKSFLFFSFPVFSFVFFSFPVLFFRFVLCRFVSCLVFAFSEWELWRSSSFFPSVRFFCSRFAGAKGQITWSPYPKEVCLQSIHLTAESPRVNVSWPPVPDWCVAEKCKTQMNIYRNSLFPQLARSGNLTRSLFCAYLSVRRTCLRVDRELTLRCELTVPAGSLVSCFGCSLQNGWQ